MNPYLRDAVLLCGDSAHLLKRDGNILYSTQKEKRLCEVYDGDVLVRLNWIHVAKLLAEDKAE